jgi:hypothetical protein
MIQILKRTGNRILLYDGYICGEVIEISILAQSGDYIKAIRTIFKTNYI